MFFFGLVAFVGDHALLLAAGLLAFLATDFFDDLLAFGVFAVADFIDGIAEFAAGVVAIHFAGAGALAFDFVASGGVLEIDAGGSFVDFLPATARALDEFFD